MQRLSSRRTRRNGGTGGTGGHPILEPMEPRRLFAGNITGDAKANDTCESSGAERPTRF